MSRQYLSKKIREFIAQRAHFRCEYCQSRADCACESFEAEHIIPQSQTGSSRPDNLAFTCRGCNSRKSDRTTALDPLSLQLEPLFNPRMDLWTEHFAWDDAFTHVIGLSPTGRATVNALQLNRQGLVNLRKLMILGGIHPPILSDQNH